MICPPDVLCKWLKKELRWETREELVAALEKEITVNGSKIHGNSMATAKRWPRSKRIERMMSLACPKRRRYAA